jgi:hypothetical protein
LVGSKYRVKRSLFAEVLPDKVYLMHMESLLATADPPELLVYQLVGVDHLRCGAVEDLHSAIPVPAAQPGTTYRYRASPRPCN